MRSDSFRTRFTGLATSVSAGFSYLMSPFKQFCADVRAQSEVLGVVLLVGIVVVATATLALYGNAAIADNEERVAVERASNGLEQFDTRASRVAFGESDVQRMDVGVTGTSGSLDTRPNDGWITVAIVNATTGNETKFVDQQPLGALVYRSGDTTVAYQGGGVWRSDGDGSAMISRPEFHVRNTTLTLPIIVTGGDGAVHSDVEVRPNGPVDKKFPDPTQNLTNKVEDVKLRITVQSDYYEAWGRYFEEHTNGFVTYNHADETVTVTYLSLPRWFNLESGIIATAGSGELSMEGSGAYTDSYNSDDGPYSRDVATANGTIIAVGGVYGAGGSNVNGDVRSGDDVDLDGNATVTGTVYHAGDFTPSNNANYDSNVTIDGVASIEPIDRFVYQNVAEIRANNNNSDTGGLITDNKLDLPPGGPDTPELGPGTYYLETMVLEGDDLNLNTTDGDITIAVRDYVQVTKRANITVIGDGKVRIFVAGENDLDGDGITGGGRSDVDDVNLHVDKKSSIFVPGHKSPQLVIYGTQEFGLAITGDGNSNQPAKFVGVVYAPAGHDGTGAAHIMHSQVYGAVVTGSLTVGQDGRIHFDEALNNERFPRSPTVTRIEYMHVSVHPIEVTSA